MQCDSAAVWQQRGRSGEQLGFVQTEATSNAQGARYTADATLAELAPSVCVSLQLFGHATVKPSECRRSARAAYEPCFLGHSSTRSASQPTVCWTSSGCFTVAATVSNSFWDGYQQSVKALLTVAHESVHLQQVRAGAAVPPNSLVEAQAECSGLQWLADVAITFGDIQVDANSLADFAFKVLYPQARRASTGYMVAHPYWSPECRPGGKLDVRRPGSTFWP